ncbi:hypothetical protein RCH10_004474 [Variovorax sp. GrIS 2.14]|uniref:hypothetical protein n=1 Tax=Variovorax sp. GrIS 2.14 TaxID=3071709 RepID=UPI0038F7B267
MQDTLELIIDEAIPGHCFWTLVNQYQAGEKPFVADFAIGPLPSRQSAIAAGNACLIRRRSGTWGVPVWSPGQTAQRPSAEH